MTKKERFEKCKETFLEIRDLFLENQENFALAKAYKKPWKFYIEHEKKECIQILRNEVNN